MSDQRTALVLGGGGITGIAWEIGVLAGLAEAGVDLTGADLVVGTSAGSVVGAQLTSGAELEAMYAPAAGAADGGEGGPDEPGDPRAVTAGRCCAAAGATSSSAAGSARWRWPRRRPG